MAKASNVVHINSRENLLNTDILKRMEFAPKSQTYILEGGRQIIEWFVTYRDKESGVLLGISPYTKLLRHSTRVLDTRVPNTIKVYCQFLCRFLNFVLIENYHTYGLTHIKDVDISHGNDFLLAYATGKVGAKKKRQATVLQASETLAGLYFKIFTIYKKEAKALSKIKWLQKSQDGTTTRINPFHIQYDTNAPYAVQDSTIFRDMPEYVFDRLLELCKIYYPHLTFALALQAYAGLRPSEVCNVRRTYGRGPDDGINFTTTGSTLNIFEINLKNEYAMRSDGIVVGHIKCKRRQRVYTPYLPIIQDLYTQHLKIISKFDLEPNYSPMFVNTQGKALTVATYSKNVKKLINDYLRKDLLESNDTKLNHYGTILLTQSLAPHYLRHFYTVRLVLDGLDPTMVAKWRGDKSTETALLYCHNKGELQSGIYHCNTAIFKEIHSRNWGT